MEYQQKLQFRILGVPGSKQSARFTGIGGKIRSFQTNETVNAQVNIRQTIISQLSADYQIHKGPVMVSYDFIFPPLKGFKKSTMDLIATGALVMKITKPDTDNLIKMAKDAMNGVVFIDDAQVWRERPSKFYGLTPMTLITVYLFKEQKL